MKAAKVTSMILLCCFGGLVRCAAEPVSERLIGWWRLDDDTNATVFADSSGHGRDADFGPDVTIAENGRFGRAAHFNGTGDSWARFISPEMTNMTISAWVYMEAYNNTLPRIMQIGPLYYHMPQNQPGQFTLGINTQNNWTTATSVPFKFETGEWFHAAVVYQQRYTNATDRVVWPIFYINGVRCNNPMPEKVFTQTIPAGSGFFGNNGTDGIRPLQGYLDEVRLYNAALTDRDILAIYHNTPLQVNADIDQSVARDQTTLQGTLASSDPFMNYLHAKLEWSVVSAPEGELPIFTTPGVAVTDVTLPETGIYTFKLTAETELGTITDEVQVTRAAAAPEGNSAPVITPGFTSATLVLGDRLTLTAQINDDSIPGTVRVRWSQLNGPGTVFFANPFSAVTTAEFTAEGTYTVRIDADDGFAQSSSEITVNVNLPSGDLDHGLEHSWHMNDNPALGAADDSSGTNTLSLRFQAILQPGKTGSGLRTPRTDSVAVAAHLPTNAPTMTFCAWIYYDDAYGSLATGNKYQRIFKCGSNFYINYEPESKNITLATRGIGTGDTDHYWKWDGFEKDQWYHIAVLFDRRAMAGGSRQTMYVNGQKLLSNIYNPEFPGAAAWSDIFMLGNLNAYGSGIRNFDGVIDDARVYSRFITDEEARLLAADPARNHPPVLEVEPQQTAATGHAFNLDAAAYDDGRPDFGSLTTQWSVISDNASSVIFNDAADPTTGVVFAESGVYSLLFTASDGELSSASRVLITVTDSGTILFVR